MVQRIPSTTISTCFNDIHVLVVSVRSYESDSDFSFFSQKILILLNSNQKLMWPNVILQASVAYKESYHNPVTTSTQKPEYCRITVSLEV